MVYQITPISNFDTIKLIDEIFFFELEANYVSLNISVSFWSLLKVRTVYFWKPVK